MYVLLSLMSLIVKRRKVHPGVGDTDVSSGIRW